MSRLRIVNGQLQLQNLTDSLWYPVDVDIFEGTAFIRSGQVAVVSPPTDDYSSYAVLLGPDENYYRFAIDTFEGTKTVRVDAIDPTTPSRIFVRGTNGLFYEIFLGMLDGNIYAEVGLAGLNPATIDSPYRMLSEVLSESERTLTEVSAKTERTIIVPVAS